MHSGYDLQTKQGGNFSGHSVELCWTLPSSLQRALNVLFVVPHLDLPHQSQYQKKKIPNPYILSVLRFNQVICVFCFTSMQTETTHNSKMEKQCCPWLHSWEEPVSFSWNLGRGWWTDSRASSDKLRLRITRGKREEGKWAMMCPPERWQIEIRAEV